MRTKTAAAVTQDDLLATTSMEELASRFNQLGYTVDAVPDDPMPYGLAGVESIREMWRFVDIGGRLRVYAFLLTALDPGIVRLVASRLQSRFPQLQLLLVFTSDWRRLAFVNVRRLYEAYDRVTVKVHRVTIDRTSPTRPDLDLVNALRCTSDDPFKVFAKHCDAFNVDKVTERFYKQYAQMFRRFLEALRPMDATICQEVRRYSRRAEDLHAFTIRLLSRVMFLYFLEKKGWLAGDVRFLENRYRECQEDGRLFYNEVLEPLFFRYLASRDGIRSPWGRIPYLNGGLFVREYPEDLIVSLPNELFDTDVSRPLDSRGLLGFFAGYNFTVEEDTPLDVQVALDPELLGKVFENLLEEKQRGRTGTFYTPRPIVNYICRESLVHNLEETTGVSRQRLLALLDEERWEQASLAKDEARALYDATLGLRVLDPAVGTGAFLVGMMQHMVQIIRACRHRLGEDLHPGTPAMADLKRDIIRDCLFGVDIEPEAIELAQLRLWLSLVLDLDPAEDPDPLPNLEFHLMLGNSLIDSVNGVSLAPEGRRPAQQMRLVMDDSDARLRRIVKLKREFFLAAELPPEQREQLRQRIRSEEMAELQRYWNEMAGECMRRIDELGWWQGQQGGHLSRAQTAELARHTAKAEVYQQATDAVASGDHTTRPFVYELEFADVFEERGGFDIVFANPPYVSVQTSSSLPYREELEHRFKEVVNGKEKGWVDDLYVHFVFRAFELARPSGIVCYITSDTYFTIQSKRRMRQLLLNHDLRIIAPCDPFKATVDAAVFLASNKVRPEEAGCEFNQMRYVSDDTFDRLSEEPAWSEDVTIIFDSNSYSLHQWTEGTLRRYRFDPRLWLGTKRMAIWEPSRRNCTLYERLILPAEPLLRQWEPRLTSPHDIEALETELSMTAGQIHAGETVPLGILVSGAQGMKTGDNGRFLAFEEGTPDAERVVDWLRRNRGRIAEATTRLDIPPESVEDARIAGFLVDELLKRGISKADLGLGRYDLYKVAAKQDVYDWHQLSEKEKWKGISNEVAWVRYCKSDPEARKWWAPNSVRILWTKSSVWYYRTSSTARWQGQSTFFKEAVTWNNVANHVPLKARLLEPAITDEQASSMRPVSGVGSITIPFLLTLLNSRICSYISKHFINNTNHYNLGDLRMLPIRIPSANELHKLEALAREGISLAISGQLDQLRALNDEVDTSVELYLGVPGLGPYEEF